MASRAPLACSEPCFVDSVSEGECGSGRLGFGVLFPQSAAHFALPSLSPGPQQLSLGKGSFLIPEGDGEGRGVLGLTASSVQ